jgi:hypothetical protein
MDKDKEKRLKKLWWSLYEIVQDLGDINSRDVVHLGISFFGQAGIDCAPSEEEGKKYMIKIIDNLELSENFKGEECE